MTEQRPRVVVIGAGFAGLAAARHLRRFDVELVLVDKRNHHLFQPLLYQVATAALSPAEIAIPIRGVLNAGRSRPVQVLMDEVVRIDKAGRRVETMGGAEIDFDYLIVATGSQYAYFGHEDDWAPLAPSLKSLDDALNIRRRVLLAFERAETTHDPQLRQRLMTFVVVGGGPTGVETAGALAELARATLAKDFHTIDTRSARVILVEALPHVLNGFPERLSIYTKEKLEQMGVEVAIDSPVEAIEDEGVRLPQRMIETSNVFWCAGVKATAAGEWLDVETEKNGAVPVRDDLTLAGHGEIFIVGDVSSLKAENGKPLPALAPVAKQQGLHAAKTILARIRNQPEPGPFRYRDWGTMATIGRAAAVGKFGKIEVTGFWAWVLWGIVHVTYLVGFRNRLVVTLNWLWAWATYAKGSRLITGPDSASIHSVDSKASVDAELDQTVTNLEASEEAAGVPAAQPR